MKKTPPVLVNLFKHAFKIQNWATFFNWFFWPPPPKKKGEEEEEERLEPSSSKIVLIVKGP